MHRLTWILSLIYSTSVLANPANPASAAGDVQQTMYLSQIYTQLKTQYDEVLKVVKNAQAASDELQNIHNLTNDLIREYEFVTNFSLANEIAQIERDIESVTMLDNMDGMTSLEKIKIINGEIDRRFRYMTPEEREKVKKRSAHIVKLNELESAKRREAQDVSSNKKMTTKDLLRSNASSTAIMTSLLLLQEQRIQEEEMNREEEAQDQREVEDAFKYYFDSQSKK